MRCRIEHVYGFIEKTMGGSIVRCVGFKRTEALQYLTVFVYNLCRVAQFFTGRAQLKEYVLSHRLLS